MARSGPSRALGTPARAGPNDTDRVLGEYRIRPEAAGQVPNVQSVMTTAGQVSKEKTVLIRGFLNRSLRFGRDDERDVRV